MMMIMMKAKKLVLTAAAVLFVASCVTLPKRAVQAVMFEELGPGDWESGDGVAIVIETTEIMEDRGSLGGWGPGDAYPLEEILEAAGRAEGLAIYTKGRWKRADLTPYRLRFRAIEKEFTRDLTVLYSVAAQVAIMHPEAERTVLKIIYHEESTASVKSLYRLYSVINTVMRKTARVIRKAQSGRGRG